MCNSIAIHIKVGKKYNQIVIVQFPLEMCETRETLNTYSNRSKNLPKPMLSAVL